MPLSATAISQALDALAGGTPSNIIGYASLHSAYDAAGGNELTGGSPAYARKAISWAAAGSGSKATSAAVTFDVPASTVAYVGLWSAATAGTFAGMGPVAGAAPLAFTAAAATDVLTAPGSSLANGATVVVFPGAGGTTPAGLTAGTVYYVVSASGATFKVSATSGGTAIDITADGSGLVQAVTVTTFGAQSQFTLSTDTITLA